MIATNSKSEFTYLRQLMEAGWAGAHSVAPVPARVLLAPVTIGACIGALSASLRRGRKPAPSLTTAALIGCAVGLGAGAAWASRGSAEAAVRKINAARDLHWLEKNPVAYG